MIDPGEQYPIDVKPCLKIDDFKSIFDAIGKSTADELIKTRFAS
jgi:hypothetical protein